MALLLLAMVCYKFCINITSNYLVHLEISCGEPPAPNENSQIASSEGTSLGDETTYTCSTGFFAVGTTTIYCQNDGTYSDDAPICKRKIN